MLKFNEYGIPKKLTKKFLKNKENASIFSIEPDSDGKQYYEYRFIQGKVMLKFNFYPKEDMVTNVYLRDMEGDVEFDKAYATKFVIDIVKEFKDNVFNLDEINKMSEFYRK